MTEETPLQYATDDVNRIIRRALKIEEADSISHKELLETAEELGIDPSGIEEAIKLEASAMEKERAKKEYIVQEKSKFKARLWTFALINGFLFVINCITPGPWWFQWPLLGMGISLAFSFRAAYFPTEYHMERKLRRRNIRRNRPHSRRHA